MALVNKVNSQFDFDHKRGKKIKLNEDVSIGAAHYTRLLYYIISRMDEFDAQRCINHQRFEAFDCVVGGFESKEELIVREDARKEAIRQGKSHEVPTMKMTTTMERLEDIKTAIMGILFPSHEFYRTIARNSADAPKARALSRIMNEEAKIFKHYSELSKVTMRALKYGWSGGYVEWSEIYGRTFARTGGVAGTSLDTENGEVTFEGNEITAFDPYNTGWDMSVDMEKVARKGEYVWTVNRENLHTLRKRVLIDEDVYGPEELAKTLKPLPAKTAKMMKSSLLKQQFDLYAEMPQIAAFGTSCRYKERNMYVYNGMSHVVPDTKTSSGGVNWDAFEGRNADNVTAFGTAEVASMWIKLNPKDFGLGTKNTIELWYFEIVNDAYIIYATKIGSGNAPLPVFLGSMGDTTHMIERSRGEIILPYQLIGERMLDQHFKAVSKSLGGGWTFVRKGMVNVQKVADTSSGIHEVRSSNHDRALGNDIVQLGNTPITQNPISEVNMLGEMARSSSPTNSGKVMTDMDRAIKTQVETARYENSRFANDLGMLLDDRMFNDMRMTMGENEYINRESFYGGIDADGKTIEFTVDDMRGVSMAISNGLMSIDRFAVMSHLETVINFAIQSGERNKFDMIKILTFYADKAGIDTDLRQFLETNPFDQLSPEIQQALLPLAQNGQLEPLMIQLIQSLQQQQTEPQPDG